MKLVNKIIFSLSCLLLITSCDQETSMITDNFDRSAMLTDWADLIIVPSYERYTLSLEDLAAAHNTFATQADESSLEILRNSFITAYTQWQRVALFEIGKAEEIGLRNYTNIYPTDTGLITSNLTNQNYNLELPSNFTAQGFPAIDYMLYGIANEDVSIIDILSQSENQQYLSDLIIRLQTLTSSVLSDWKNRYREQFIQNSGSSGTASVDKMVNDFLYHYEKYVRAGKVGIPAGVFSGNTLSHSVEAVYAESHSKELFTAGLNALEDFFVGRSYDKTSTGISLQDYLNFMRDQNETIDIAAAIIDQWEVARLKSSDLSDNFKEQIETDNIQMLELYDELQKAVILLKVDMMSALNIQVDFVDADGD